MGHGREGGRRRRHQRTPGGTYFPDVDADWYLIGGDEAALPAIGTLLEALPSSIRAYVLAEVRHADEGLELESAAGLQIRWLHRRAGEMPGRALAAAMREAELPQGKKLRLGQLRGVHHAGDTGVLPV